MQSTGLVPPTCPANGEDAESGARDLGIVDNLPKEFLNRALQPAAGKNRIVGGNTTTIREYPYQVSLGQ